MISSEPQVSLELSASTRKVEPAPGEPGGPAGPAAPWGPGGPAGPAAPAAPATPGGPAGPWGPAGPGSGFEQPATANNATRARLAIDARTRFPPAISHSPSHAAERGIRPMTVA